eukprot:403361832
MKASNILDDYISSFESSVMYSNKKPRNKENVQNTASKSFERHMGSINLSHIASANHQYKDETNFKYGNKNSSSVLGYDHKRLTLDEIQTKGKFAYQQANSFHCYDNQQNNLKVIGYKKSPLRERSLMELENSQNQSKLLNFKEFYENSKLETSSTKNSNSQVSKSSQLFRSKSSGNDRDKFQNNLQSKLLNIKPLIKYDINEYLPKNSSLSSKHSNSLLHSNLTSNSFLNVNPGQQQQQQNLFSNNLMQNVESNYNSKDKQHLSLSHLALSPNINVKRIQPHIPGLNNQNDFQSQQCLQCSCGGQNSLPQFYNPYTKNLNNGSQQILLTQRSSCSCQYSQSSAQQSQYASPLSSNQKQNPLHNGQNQNIFAYNQPQRGHSHSYSNSLVNINRVQSQPQIPNNIQIINQSDLSSQQSSNKQLQNPFATYAQNVFTSNENTPYKLHQENPNQVQNPINQLKQNLPQQIHTIGQQNFLLNQASSQTLLNKSPQQNQSNIPSQNNPQFNQQETLLYPDRSISFIRSTDKKEKTLGGGYNTDDLIRDTDSEVDLNQVSNIIQDANDQFMNGFQNYLKLSEIKTGDDRAQKEFLAMQILQNNQMPNSFTNNQLSQDDKLNQSQLKTIKQSQIQVNQNPLLQQQHQPNQNHTLTLDSLHISNINNLPSMIQTPQSLIINTNKTSSTNDPDNFITQKGGSKNSNQQISQIQQQMLFQQQYQSPYFQSSEDSTGQFNSNQSQQQQHLQTNLTSQHQIGSQIQMKPQNPSLQVTNIPQQLLLNLDDANSLTLKNLQVNPSSKNQILLNNQQIAQQQIMQQYQQIQLSNQNQLTNQQQLVPSQNSQNNLIEQQQQQESKSRSKSKNKSKNRNRNKSITKKLTKKTYNEEDYSSRKHHQIINDINGDAGDQQTDQQQDTTSYQDQMIDESSQQYQDYEPSINYLSQNQSRNYESNAQNMMNALIANNYYDQQNNHMMHDVQSNNNNDGTKTNTNTNSISVSNQTQEGNNTTLDSAVGSQQQYISVNYHQQQQFIDNPYPQHQQIMQNYSIIQQQNTGYQQQNDQIVHIFSDDHYNTQNTDEDFVQKTDQQQEDFQDETETEIEDNNNEYRIDQYQSANKNDQSLLKVLSQMNNEEQQQMLQSYLVGNQSQVNDASFLDQSEIQVNQPQIKQANQDFCNDNNVAKLNKQYNQKLPPQQKKQHSNALQIPTKSMACSNLSSKNSTIVPGGNNHHYQSHNPSQREMDDYYLHMDDESLQNQMVSIADTNNKREGQAQGKAQIQIQTNGLSVLQHNSSANQFIQPGILSPYGPHTNGSNLPHYYHNYDHFKSQCSEVIIRGSSETDISNRIAAMKQLKNQSHSDSNSHHFQSQNTNLNQQHSHQISGCQSIVNLAEPPHHSRSQFTSIDTHNYSPTKAINKRNDRGSSQPPINLPKSSNARNDKQTQQVQQNELIEVNCLRSDIQMDSSYEPNDRFYSNNDTQNILAGDTFMKSSQKLAFGQNNDTGKINQFLKNYQQVGNGQQILDMFQSQNQYKSIETENNNLQDDFGIQQTTGSAQQPTEDDFNYTIRLDEMNQAQKSQSNSHAQRPPIYQGAFSQHHSLPAQSQTNQQQHNQQQYTNPYLNGTGSTAGFPQLHGYQFSQQTGRKSISNSSFHSQMIKNSNSQSSLPMISQRSMQNKARIKKLSFMEKITLIQRHVRDYLSNKKQREANLQQFTEEQDDVQDFHLEQNLMGFYGGDSTIQKPQDESLSNISAQLLNSLKQSLGGSNLRQIKPSDQSYQKNILESLNLTTGNTFIKDTRHFNQGILNKERTQNFGNSSHLVLYSGSTHDNRVNPFQRNSVARQSENNYQGGNLESQQSFQKPPLYLNDPDFQQRESSGNQQLSPNNTSILNMTEESNSGIFKLTPMASQNITQKTGHIINAGATNGGYYNQTSSQMNATESNNLNYSCSEIESEWYLNNIQKDCNTVSPMSINTTSSKLKTLMNGNKPGQRIINGKSHANSVQNQQEQSKNSNKLAESSNSNILFQQRRGSVQSEQLQPLSFLNGMQKNTQQIVINDNIQSPLSLHQVASTRSAQADILLKQEKMLNLLKSVDDYHQDVPKHQDDSSQDNNLIQVQQKAKSGQKINNCAWKILKPIKQSDFNQLLMSMIMSEPVQQQSSTDEDINHIDGYDSQNQHQKYLTATELH